MRLARSLPLVLAVSLLLVVSAEAHALLIRSSPDADAKMLVAPATIEMWFSEPLESAFTSARVIGQSGEEVPTGAAVVDSGDPSHLTLPLGNLDPGIYTVAWQTLSQVDGHEWFGSFPITVLNPDGSSPAGSAAPSASARRGDLPTIGETVTRWLTLSGSMLLFGGLAFQAIVIPESQIPALRSKSARTISVLLAVSLIAVVAGSIGQAVLQAMRLGGVGELSRLAVGTRTGTLVLGRILLSVVGLFVLFRIEPLDRAQRLISYALIGVALIVAGLQTLAALGEHILIPLISLVVGIGGLAAAIFKRGRRYHELILWVIATTLLVSFSISSHAGAVQGSVFAVSADLLHLVAASIWIGGLILLPLLWVRLPSPDLRAELAIAVRRFSLLAGGSVFVILLTGVFNSFVELPSLQSLWETPYGLLLLAKLALVGAALLVAALNNRRVRSSADPENLAYQIAFEAGIAIVVLVAVALLVQTPTPRSLAAPAEPAGDNRPFNQINPTDDLNVHVQVDPNQSGNNRFWVHLYRDDGSGIGEVQLVRLFFEHADQNLGRSSVDLEALGQDTFATEGAYIGQPGPWNLSVYVRRRSVDDLLSDIRVEVPPDSGSQQSLSPLGNPIPELPPQALLGSFLIVLGAIPILWRRQVTGELARTYAVGIVLMIVGSVALVLGITRNEIPLNLRTNPELPTTESLARGEAIYTESCSVCHGITGLGDGPLGVTLDPRPANLAVHMVPGVHTDGQILEWISNGFPNSSMPAFAGTYNEEERWHLINYIRTFAVSEEE